MTSILYPTIECKQASKNPIGLSEAYMLDEAFLRICPDVKKRAYFLDVVAENPNALTAMFRAEILRDFNGEKNLDSQLKNLFQKLNEILLDFEDGRKRIFTFGDKKGSDSSIYASSSRLNMTALTLEQLLSVLHDISAILTPLEFRSEGLCALQKRMESFHGSKEYYDLSALCKQYSDFNYENGASDLLVHLDDSAEIIKTAFLRQYRTNTSSVNMEQDAKTRFPFFRTAHKPKHADSVANVFSAITIGKYQSNIFISQAVDTLTNTFSAVINAIKSDFYDICAELDFYYVARSYCEFLSEIDAFSTFPQISDTAETHLVELYDLYLLAKDHSKNNTVPNDFLLDNETKGILIKGDNGSGKTVFLRSVATAQLLAMAGLPIPAKQAVLSVRKIYSLFASSEKSLNDSAVNAGRFEEEVRDVAAILNGIDGQALLILNEIFQTTAYTEGAEGLFHILKYLSFKGVQWVVVTHMLTLFDMFDKDNVKKMEVDKATHVVKNFT